MNIQDFWFPLSGDINQGFINIYNSATSKPEKEREIATKVASYGSQLGTLIDAMEVIIGKDFDNLKKDERIGKFYQLSDKIKNISEYDKILKKLNHLKLSAPEKYNDIVRQLDE